MSDGGGPPEGWAEGITAVLGIIALLVCAGAFFLLAHLLDNGTGDRIANNIGNKVEAWTK